MRRREDASYWPVKLRSFLMQPKIIFGLRPIWREFLDK